MRALSRPFVHSTPLTSQSIGVSQIGLRTTSLQQNQIDHATPLLLFPIGSCALCSRNRFNPPGTRLRESYTSTEYRIDRSSRRRRFCIKVSSINERPFICLKK